jgi:hypothetical protein
MARWDRTDTERNPFNSPHDDNFKWMNFGCQEGCSVLVTINWKVDVFKQNLPGNDKGVSRNIRQVA